MGQCKRVNPAGSVARIGLVAVDHDTDIQVDLSLDRYTELNLKPGDTSLYAQKSACLIPEYVI